MSRMILRRITLCAVQLLILTLLVFFLSELMPGDALTGMISPSTTGAQLAEMREKLGLDKPWTVRYTGWLTGIIHGDFGVSYTHKLPVTKLVSEKFGNTALLGLSSLIICVSSSILLGVIAGKNHSRWPDKLISSGSFVLMSTPQAVFGVLAIFLFAYTLGLFPAGGSVSATAAASGAATEAASRLHHVFLPSLTLAGFNLPILVQLARSEVIANQNSEYIYVLRSRGLSENRIFWVHVLRNSLIPIAALTGSLIAALLGGTVLVESVFSYPGIGKLFVDSILKRDYPTANFLILLTALIAILGTLVSDILMHRLDPRVKMR